MKFHESGLPKDSKVEKAFEYSRLNMMANEKEAVRDYNEQINARINEVLVELESDKIERGMKDIEYDAHKQAIETMRQQNIARGPALVRAHLTRLFVQRRVGLAQTLAKKSDGASNDLIAAALLADCVRSPVDYKNIEKQFGAGIAGLVAEIVHIDAYASERHENLTKAGTDVRRAYMAMTITAITNTTAQVAEVIKDAEEEAKATRQKGPLPRPVLPPEQESQIFDDVKILWGVDKKLDTHVVDAFNKLTALVQSPFKIEVGADGKPALVKDVAAHKKNPDNKPPKPKDNGSIGGDLFD